MPRPRLRSPEYRIRRYKGDTFYIFWTEGGATRSQTTGYQDETLAKQYLAAWIEARNAPPDESVITVTQVCDIWLAWKQKQMEDRSAPAAQLVQAKAALKRFTDHYGDWNPGALTRNTFRAYIESRKRLKDADGNIREESTGTTRKTLALLSAAFNHCHDEGYLSAVPPMVLPPHAPRRERWLTTEECRKLIAACKTPHMKLFVMLALHTCSRKGAILELTWQQVDMVNRRIHFNPENRRQTKKRRVPAPINKVLYAALEDARQAATSDFVVECNGRQVKDVKVGFKLACKRAGLTDVCPHTLRHTGATLMAQAGVPLWRIAGLLGDTTVTVENVYAKHHTDYLKDAVEALETAAS